MIPRDRVNVSFSRSGGPGGQNVNKVATKAEIRFLLDAADWLPADVRGRLRALFPSRVTTAGEFLVVSDRLRSQPQNLEDAFEKLEAMIRAARRPPKIRRPSKPTKASKARRLDAKSRRSDVKRGRRDAGWD